MMTEKIQPSPLLMQCGTVVVAAAIAWGVNSSQVAALADITKDHETRIRSLENLILVQYGELKGDIKSEFHGMKLRVTSLEKAVEKAAKQ